MHVLFAGAYCYDCYVQVESVFTLSVSELLDPAFRMVDDLGLRGQLPAFTAGPSRVWGLTAQITDGVLRNGVVPLLQQTPSSPLAEDGGARQHDAPGNSKGSGSSSL